MTRLLTALMLSALMPALTQPAQAQETAPAAETVAPDAAAPKTEDGDDDATDAAPSGAYQAAGKCDYGFSGIMARDNRTDLAPLTLASGQPVAGGEYRLKSGGFYRLPIIADGSAELALSGGDFFRAIWINEIVINDIEIRPMGVHSLEFDDAGTATISFVAIVPGRHVLSIPGSTGATQQAVFTIE